MRKVKKLERLASELIGDGKEPNLFFLSIDGVITLVARNFNIPFVEWISLRGKYKSVLIEDRKNGIVCECELYGKKWHCEDNSRRWGIRK